MQAGLDQSLPCLTGDVMPGNLGMQALSSSQQFDCSEHPQQPEVVRDHCSLCQRQPHRTGFFNSLWLH